MHLLPYFFMFIFFHGLTWKQYYQLDLTLGALESGLKYLANNYQDLEVQDVVATRMVHDQLRVLLTRLMSGDAFKVPYHTLRRILTLQLLADSITTKSTPYANSKYNAADDYHVEFTRKNFWQQNFDGENLDFSLLDIEKTNKSLTVDSCLNELLRKHYQCGLSMECWINMTQSGLDKFNITKQVFYFMVGESTGCFIGSFGQYTHRYVNKFCANIILETIDIEVAGYPAAKRELFMEQQALCLMNGFHQFATDDWLDVILNLQLKEQGCWGLQPDTSNGTVSNTTYIVNNSTNNTAVEDNDHDMNTTKQTTPVASGIDGHENQTIDEPTGGQEMESGPDNESEEEGPNTAEDHDGGDWGMEHGPESESENEGLNNEGGDEQEGEPGFQVKKRDVADKDGACSTRLTAKAVITLTQYVRFIIEYL